MIEQSSARRCLFGIPDRKRLSQDLEAQNKAFDDAANLRFRNLWGWDLAKQAPVDGGNCTLVQVDPTREYIPEFYMKGYVHRSRPRSRLVNTSVDENVTVALRIRPTKRKLVYSDSDKDSDDENRDSSMVETRPKMVPCSTMCEPRVPSLDQHVEPFVHSDINAPSLSSSATTTSVPDQVLKSDITSEMCPSPSLLKISPGPRSADLITPVVRQRSITDYCPMKKKRFTNSAVSATISELK